MTLLLVPRQVLGSVLPCPQNGSEYKGQNSLLFFFFFSLSASLSQEVDLSLSCPPQPHTYIRILSTVSKLPKLVMPGIN